jgi:hypothetical protein
MGGAALAGWLWLAAEVSAGASVEVAAGHAPVVPGQRSEAGLTSTLSPSLAITSRASRVWQLRLGYDGRLTWRQPNAATRVRPLDLHTVMAQAESRPTERLFFRSQASVTEGEADYGSWARVLGSTQSALPSTLNVLRMEASLDLEHRFTRLARGGLNVAAIHLGESPRDPRQLTTDAMGAPVAPVSVLPTQTGFSLAPRATFGLGRHDDLTLETSLSQQSFENLNSNNDAQVEFLTASQRVAWTHRHGPAGQLEVGAGVFVSHDNGETDVGPLANVAATGKVLDRAGAVLQARGEAGVALYIEPVLARPLPQGALTTGLTLLSSRGFTGDLAFTFATNVGGDPLPGTPDETLVAATLSGLMRLSRVWSAGLSFRTLNRGPHLAADDFAFRQRELWLGAVLAATWVAR